MTKIKIIPVCAAAAALLFSCTKGDKITGTTDETVISAYVFKPDLSPAVQAKIKVFTVNDTSRIPVYQTTTDNSGKYTIDPGKGMFNVLATKDSLAAFQDSVIVQTNYSSLTNDTLSRSVVLAGLVTMQPMHDPRTVIVQIIGTDKYANVSASGSFIINGLAPGEYNLRSETTIQSYTPTFTTLSIAPMGPDTVRDTINLVYTGIPVITSLKTVYDTVSGVVNLMWDTTDYIFLRDFVVYRDMAPVVTPSAEPIGATPICSYSDTVRDFINGTQTGFVYRVAVRAKNLDVGETFTDIQVNAVLPLTVSPMSDSVPFYLGVPYTLKGNVSGYSDPRVSYFWDIGNKGVFVQTMKPETTIIFHDTITNNFQCVFKLLLDNKIYFVDTAKLTTELAWRKVAETFVDSLTVAGIHTVVLGDKIVAFTMPMSLNAGLSVWQSTNGSTWSQNTDSLAIPYGTAWGGQMTKPVVFLNKLCLVDNQGYLWTSSDAISWTKASGAPLCNTVKTDSTFPSGIATGTACPPALFVDGSKILLQPFQGTGSQTILSSSDLINWDSTSGYQMQGVVDDFAESNGTLAVVGTNWDLRFIWFCIKNASGLSYISPVWSSSSFGGNPYMCSFETYKGTILFASNQDVWSVSTSSNQPWFSCSTLPKLPCSIVVFKNELYVISPSGIFKAPQ